MSEEQQIQIDRRAAWNHFRRIVGLIPHLHRAIWVCVAVSVAISAIDIALPQLMALAVDGAMTARTTATSQRLHSVRELGTLYFCLLAISSLMTLLVTIKLNEIGQRAVQQMRVDVFAHLHRLPIHYFDRNPVGRVVTRIANDTGTLAELFTGVLSNLLNDILKFMILWVALLWVSPKLTACLLLLAPPLFAATYWFQNESREVQRKIRTQLALLNAFLQENLSGLTIIKSFVAEKLMSERFRQRNQTYFDIEMRLVRLYSIFRPLFGSASMVALALLIYVGGRQVQAGALSLGSLVAYVFYLKLLFNPLDNLAEKFNVFQSAAVAAERIFEILDTPVESDVGGPDIPLRGEIEFRDVSFSYDESKPVLKGVSFRVEPGQKVAVVGSTGSGKTTLTNLLFRFYRLEERGQGQILVDGRPIQEWPLASLRRQLGLVQQELFLFRNDIRNNVNLYRDIPEQRLQEALRVSRANKVVERYPLGLNQMLGERGQQVSQGERQLLSFARALVEDPPVLILDEATASVDSLTEATIQEALEQLLEGRTALIIAHRLSTIRRCDQILVLEKGEIVERGRHEELLALNGVYAELCRHQQEIGSTEA